MQAQLNESIDDGPDQTKACRPFGLNSGMILGESAQFIVLMDDKKTNNFPDTIVSSNDTRVYVGHIRSDSSLKQNIGWNFWISGDQLLRGAAYNAVMILNKLL